MNKIISLLLMLSATLGMWAQGSGQGYDPVNPPDPQAGYRLKLEAAPEKGGSVSPAGVQMHQAGDQVWCDASPRFGYKFREWREGDKVVSTSSSFHYEMPNENVTLTAWFDIDTTEYDPANPGDPFFEGYYHTVRIFNSPSIGGYSNNSSFTLKEGEETTIYAYPNSNFKFSCWKQNGEIISTSRELKIKMGTKNQEYTAQFVYDPTDPGEPLPNLWNPSTGELIMDHFSPGNLWDAIYNIVGYDNMDKVTTLTVIGRMDNYDMGCVRNLPQLTDADFSRTSGATYVPSWIFENCQALTKVCLPASIEEIQYAAFYGCGNLSEIDIYASMPPSIDSDNTFYGVPETMVVKVYSSSIDLYQDAPYWKDYKIMTLDEDNTSLTVNLPADGADGRYRNASLELSNLSTGQTQRLIVTGTRTKYVFGNLIPDMKYSLYVYSPNGTEIGSETDFDLPQGNKEITLSSLRQMHEVSLTLLNAEGADLTSQASISWYDAAHTLLGHGSTLAGQLTDDELGYEITLSRELGLEYRNVDPGTWTVADAGNDIKVTLDRHPKTTITGKLTEKETGLPISSGYVTIAQKLNGQHDTAAIATTAADGSYSIEIYDAPGTITAGSRDHIEMTYGFADAQEAKALANATLSPLAGTEITLTLLSRPNIEAGAAETAFTAYEDYKGVSYTVRNLTKKEECDYRLRYPVMTILGDIDEGDQIEITARPGNQGLLEASATTEATGGKGAVTLKLISNGDIRVTHTGSEAEETIALLYGEDGNLVGKMEYDAGDATQPSEAAFAGVKAGKYTIVSMASSPLFSGAGTLSDLADSKLTAGTDYLTSETEVKDGYISVISLGDIPAFDESIFLYTGGETSVGVNKTNVTVGSIVTVRSKVEFLPEYKDRIWNIRMTFNLPEGCEYVDNSLITPGAGVMSTTVAQGKLTVDLNKDDAAPRFCIIPRKGGDFRPSATIEFELDGETIKQPIGSALFTAGDFTLSVPPKTSTTRITARGGTTALSDIKVYDNDVLVGTTRSLTNGSWRLSFDLYNPGDLSEHIIRAEITTPEGIKYRTTPATTLYDKEWAELTDIRMIYGGTTIDFNHIDATTSPASYSYVPGNDMFTFKTDFREGHAEKVKELYYVILLSDGSYRKIEGVYLPSVATWTCALGFPDVNRLPVNVKVIYSEKRKGHEELPEWKPEEGTTFRCPDVIPVIDPSGYVYEAVTSNRLPGVEATIFYKEYTEDMYGDVHEKMTKWDAEAYAQENPLFTDAEGMYQWDVPQGEWMVRFEKEGYETAQTDWLPVPPPQLDVNVGMTQMVRPQVKEAHAYEQSVEIEFDKYMTPARLNTSTIVVMEGDKKAEGTITLLNEEEADGNRYASKIRFEATEPFGADNVKLMVSNKVTSYAGIQMEQAFEQEFAVEPSITAINVEDQTRGYAGGEGKITVEVLPADAAQGKTLIVNAGSEIVSIDESATLDEEGKAEISFTGELPGIVDITISVEGSSLEAAVTRLTLTAAPIFADNILLDKVDETLTLGEMMIIGATVLPEETTDKTIVWTSSDETVATVDENGEVSIVGVGKVVITATCGETTSECTLKCYPETGDADWNGEVTITDAVDITNYVVKKKSVPAGWDEEEWTEFYTVGANANGDEEGNITFADASATVQLMLAATTPGVSRNLIRNANDESEETTDALTATIGAATTEGRTPISVMLSNSIEYVALQADIIAPEGVNIEVKGGSRTAGSHTLETKKHADNHIRVALYNLGNKAFADNSEPILEIIADSRLSDADELTIANILASTAEATEYRLGWMTRTETGVESNLNGKVTVTKVAGGIQIANAAGKNVAVYTPEGETVRTFTAKESIETISLSPGIYIIKAGDVTLKAVM